MIACSTTTFIKSVTSFGIGDIHTHTAPFISHSSLLQESISNNLVTTITNPAAINIFDKYMSTLSDYPLPTKMITGACLATAGDAIAPASIAAPTYSTDSKLPSKKNNGS